MAEIYATVTQSLTEDFNNPSSPLDTPPFLSIPEQAEHLDTAIDNFYTAYIQYLDDNDFTSLAKAYHSNKGDLAEINCSDEDLRTLSKGYENSVRPFFNDVINTPEIFDRLATREKELVEEIKSFELDRIDFIATTASATFSSFAPSFNTTNLTQEELAEHLELADAIGATIKMEGELLYAELAELEAITGRTINVELTEDDLFERFPEHRDSFEQRAAIEDNSFHDELQGGAKISYDPETAPGLLLKP